MFTSQMNKNYEGSVNPNIPSYISTTLIMPWVIYYMKYLYDLRSKLRKKKRRKTSLKIHYFGWVNFYNLQVLSFHDSIKCFK